MVGSGLPSDFENLGERLKDRAIDLLLERGEGLIEWTSDQLLDLASLTDDMAASIMGDERARVHLNAVLAMKGAQAKFRGYLEVAAFRAAMADAILEIVGSFVSAGANVAGKALASALTEVVEG